ncbi:hypothetical protein E5676_scaffold610G00300 [Cucumis melo var. makuwa]|uniref:Uncharacterized protein n=1 Tax=Cucumis melo var. makuwa TaxID=1194695 RepID=A0A5A7U708_CUCMM|nr:hypothetical protein E6C27_scaffold174G00630 [Cucumis melo var. makuwa]TYK24132.1 hypothetical protein E5676_scaffold610G00300 [Cucumis melo var. makuwa]
MTLSLLQHGLFKLPPLVVGIIHLSYMLRSLTFSSSWDHPPFLLGSAASPVIALACQQYLNQEMEKFSGVVFTTIDPSRCFSYLFSILHLLLIFTYFRNRKILSFSVGDAQFHIMSKRLRNSFSNCFQLSMTSNSKSVYHSKVFSFKLQTNCLTSWSPLDHAFSHVSTKWMICCFGLPFPSNCWNFGGWYPNDILKLSILLVYGLEYMKEVYDGPPY